MTTSGGDQEAGESSGGRGQNYTSGGGQEWTSGGGQEEVKSSGETGEGQEKMRFSGEVGGGQEEGRSSGERQVGDQNRWIQTNKPEGEKGNPNLAVEGPKTYKQYVQEVPKTLMKMIMRNKEVK